VIALLSLSPRCSLPRRCRGVLRSFPVAVSTICMLGVAYELELDPQPLCLELGVGGRARCPFPDRRGFAPSARHAS
jgi:hypothetical protein